MLFIVYIRTRVTASTGIQSAPFSLLNLIRYDIGEAKFSNYVYTS